MAKFITFNGVTLYHPGGLTKIDAAGMAQVGAGLAGIVGLIGEADAGQPCTAADPKVYEFTDPSAALEVFKSGDMADAIDFIFNPSSDVRIPGGAQKLICVKTNASTQSSATLVDQSENNNAITVQSAAYGVDTAGINIRVSQNSSDDDKFDATVKDTANGVTETFTSIGGTALMNVKYQGPADPVVVATVTTTTGHTHSVLNGSFNTTITKAGQWVKITEDASEAYLVGQIRRIESLTASAITVSTPFAFTGGQEQAPSDLCKIEIIRTVIGPFWVNGHTSGSAIFTMQGVPTAAAHTATSSFDGVTGFTSWSLIGTNGGPDVSMCIDTGEHGLYGDVENGPCYVKIVSGAGVGQIRRVTGVVGDDVGAGADGDKTHTITCDADFSPALDATSRFMFINAVNDASSAGSGHGAMGIIEGANGVASKLILKFRPGYGESDGTASGVVGSGGADNLPNLHTVYEYALGSDITVDSLVNKINTSTGNSNSPANVTAHPAGAWVAQVGPGRSGSLTTDRFDFMISGGTALTTDLTNGGDTGTLDFSDTVDLLVDFDQQYSGTFGTSSDLSVKKHRFLDNCAQLEDALDGQSLIVNATRTTTAAGDGCGMPKFNPNSPVSLTGGVKGDSSASTVELAFEQLIKKRHNTCVALFSSDYSSGGNTFTIEYVHSQLKSHANNGAGSHRNEVDCIAAFDASVVPATALQDIIDKSNTLNNRNVGLVYQKIQRPALTGTNKIFGPEMLACALAGMQSGATVGEPLTFKFVNALDIISPVLADPQDKNDSDQLLQNSVLFCEEVKGKGFRVVRNYSTYAQDDNLAYTERHVNAELNYMAYDLRSFIEDQFTGLKATPATVANIKSTVVSKLEIYKRDLEIIVDSTDPVNGKPINAYRNIKVTISGDIATIRFEIFPTIGINYFKFDIVAQLPTISA